MKLGFIGFGNMAQALCDGFLGTQALHPDQIGACAQHYDKLCVNAARRGIRAFDSAAAVVDFADFVVIAVKPNLVETVVTPILNKLAQKVVISVAAGMTFERYEAILAAGTHHLSTVPNTPVAVGAGIIVCERRHSLSEEEWADFERLFSAVALIIPIDTPLLGVAGTVCGCTPAFAAMFIEALADAAVKHGIPRADAYRMASQVLVGTGSLQLATAQHPGVLKDAVCSPGGTTIVGVAELERTGFRGAVIDAVDAIERKK